MNILQLMQKYFGRMDKKEVSNMSRKAKENPSDCNKNLKISQVKCNNDIGNNIILKSSLDFEI